MIALPPLLSRAEVDRRLKAIFPEGVVGHGLCTNEIASAIVFVAIYMGAIGGSSRRFGPKHVYRMSEAQAAMTSDAERIAYDEATRLSGSVSRGTQWYADNSREGIRDDAINKGFFPVGAITKANVATTSSKPRYQLAEDFAALFDPAFSEAAFEAAAQAWRDNHLTTAALARIEVLRAGRVSDGSDVVVTFPNGAREILEPGPSSVITKHVIEEFAPRYLERAGVIWVSTSGKKVTHKNEVLAKRLGLQLSQERLLPDVILVDTGPTNLLLVFVEVVATDGPITEERRKQLIAAAPGYRESDMAFVTAFMDRNLASKMLLKLAWNSFAWFASEPEKLMNLMHPSEEQPVRLHKLVRGTE